MEVVVTTGATTRAKSSPQIVTINKPTSSFYRLDALPVECRQTNSAALMGWRERH